MSEGIRSEQLGAVLRVNIDRPERANALSAASARALIDCLIQAACDPNVAVVELRGEGTRAFCSGFDLDRIGDEPTGLEALMAAVEGCPVPVVAAVNGHAVGAGFELACRCDLRVVRRGVRVGLPAVRLGVAYRADGVAAILATVPAARMALLTGAQVQADSLPGFADAIADADGFEAAVRGVTDELAQAAPRALEYTLAVTRALRAGRLDSEADALASHREAVMTGGDVLEAITARSEGRPASFADRRIPPRP